MRESLAVHEFALQMLENDSPNLVIDLSSCEYLDSTFLGCLFELHKLFDGPDSSRVLLLSPSPRCLSSMASVKLDTILEITGEKPESIGEFVPLSSEGAEVNELGEHVLKCHQRLSQLGGEDTKVFEAIAGKLDRELHG